MGAVKNLCKRGIVLNQGQVAFDGGVEEAINYYTDSNVKNCERKVIINDRDHREGILPKDLEFVEAEMLNPDIEHLATDEPLQFRVKIKKNNPSIKKFTIGTHAVNMSGSCEITTASPVFDTPDKAVFAIELSVKNHTLAKGNYKIYFNIGIKDVAHGTTDYDIVKNVLFCQILYKNKNTQEAYSGWQNGWGNHYVESVEYKLD